MTWYEYRALRQFKSASPPKSPLQSKYFSRLLQQNYIAIHSFKPLPVSDNPYVINGMPFPSSWIITDDGKSAIRQYRLDKLKAVIKSPLLWLSALAAAVINISTIANAVKTAYDVLCG